MAENVNEPTPFERTVRKACQHARADDWFPALSLLAEAITALDRRLAAVEGSLGLLAEIVRAVGHRLAAVEGERPLTQLDPDAEILAAHEAAEGNAASEPLGHAIESAIRDRIESQH